MPTFTRRTRIDVPAQDLFDWHNHRGAFERLAPPWQPGRLERFDGIRDGDRAVIKLGPEPAALTWIAEHHDYIEGRQFRDVQIKGPFARWEHTHRMISEDDSTSVIEDDVTYRLPLAPITQRLGGGRGGDECAHAGGQLAVSLGAGVLVAHGRGDGRVA